MRIADIWAVQRYDPGCPANGALLLLYYKLDFRGLPGFLICALLLLAMLAACSSFGTVNSLKDADQIPDSVERVRSQHEFEMAGAEGLEVTNLYGDLHVHNGKPGLAQLELFIQRKSSSQAQATVSSELHQDVLELSINIVPDSNANDILRIDVVLTVPTQPWVSLSTKSGMIEVKKLSNPEIAASSESGDLRLTASSLMRAHTEQGRIRATQMRPGWAGESHLSSGSGQIQAFFPLSPNLFLQAKAATEIRSEFKLPIRILDGMSHARFEAGDGTDRIVVESREGGVELYSLVYDPRVYGAPSITEKQSVKVDGTRYEN